MTNTDQDWRAWGERDPYFAVITNPKFRRANLDDDAIKQFFVSGQQHVDYLLARCRRFIDPKFEFGRSLDFGCGVGRVLLPLARVSTQAVGVDVSPAMLEEARKACEREGVIDNVTLAESDDTLSRVEGKFDFVHTFIVLQHIDITRGRNYFARLVDLVAPGGAGALHFTYAKRIHAASYGRPPAPVAPPSGDLTLLERLRKGVDMREAPVVPAGDPQMQMNTYPLNDMMFILQNSGVTIAHLEFTDHGGELGVVVFFRRPPAQPA